MPSLAGYLQNRIRADGPMPVDRFMAAALGDPEFGYYRTRDPFGVDGDFTTAPEISQIFGEILGLWCADQWQILGCPRDIHLVELGPGRGTLMADMLRAMAVLPACRDALTVHLVEFSPILRNLQQITLTNQHPLVKPHWHDSLDSLPDGPILLVANEFFDALPIRQFIAGPKGWQERLVGLDPDGGFTFLPGPVTSPPIPPPLPVPPHEGADGLGVIFETNEPAHRIGTLLGQRLAQQGGAALIIDYGHPRTALGETLQALAHHRPVPVLAQPGMVDLTAHVDFAALGQAISAGGATIWGPVPQGRFLLSNGAELRQAALMRGKDPEAAQTIRAGLRRLIDPGQMGQLFKVLAATGPGYPAPSGF